MVEDAEFFIFILYCIVIDSILYCIPSSAFELFFSNALLQDLFTEVYWKKTLLKFLNIVSWAVCSFMQSRKTVIIKNIA